MNRRIILTPEAAPPIGPYNQAVHVTGPLIFTSGQIPLDAQGQLVSGGIAEQTHAVFANLKAILEAAGSGLDRVIKTTVFLADLADFGTMNGIYETYFPGSTAPARSTIQVARLPKDARIEIEAVALAGD
ncbi:MAG TPA: RidA family protein [Kiritimatiellia bacterium]|nr:RidA family protein [Kiritimatiellia bacterium]HMO98864.1 RidA family protein [Kiritimatiellia bacterium]HMP97285.1 RidA family protein [Kiritimatiellia bacterium]